MFQRILVPIDGSTTSAAGLRQAIALAEDQGAVVYLLHVVDELVVTQGFDGMAFVLQGKIGVVINALASKDKDCWTRPLQQPSSVRSNARHCWWIRLAARSPR